MGSMKLICVMFLFSKPLAHEQSYTFYLPKDTQQLVSGEGMLQSITTLYLRAFVVASHKISSKIILAVLKSVLLE